MSSLTISHLSNSKVIPDCKGNYNPTCTAVTVQSTKLIVIVLLLFGIIINLIPNTAACVRLL